MGMREFKSAAESQTLEELGTEPISFKIDEDEFTAYPPTPAQFALFMASQGSNTEPTDQIAGVIDFFNGLLPDDQRMLFRRRLLDRDDPLGLEMIMDVVAWLSEEWSARPTESPSDSTPQRQRTGTRSTAKRSSKASIS
jgi:hypothetical protein